jgi:hypothetical protein
MHKNYFHITPQKNFMVNNGNRMGGTAPHHHSTTGA